MATHDEVVEHDGSPSSPLLQDTKYASQPFRSSDNNTFAKLRQQHLRKAQTATAWKRNTKEVEKTTKNNHLQRCRNRYYRCSRTTQDRKLLEIIEIRRQEPRQQGDNMYGERANGITDSAQHQLACGKTI